MDNPTARAHEQRDHTLAPMGLLDWLRFVLASIVAIEHQGIDFPGPISGTLAVDVFLALSGWLVGGILLRSSRADMPRFYFNRATRIWIPYLFAIVALYAVAAFKDGIDIYWWKYLFYDVTFTHYSFTIFPQAAAELPMDGTGNHFWSISVEEQFYLLLPLAIVLPLVINRTVMWAVAIAALLLMGGRFTPIAFGVLAAIAQLRFGDWHLSTGGRMALAVAGLAAFAALFLGENVYFSSVLSVAIVLLLSTPMRRGRFGQFFGAVSFPFYLNAWIGIFAANIALRIVPLPYLPEQVFKYALSVGICAVLWWCIDRPVMANRAKWYTPALGKSLAIAAYTIVGIGFVGGTLIKMAG